MSNVSEAVAELDAVTGADPDVDPEIADAYKRLVQRCSWWACA